MELHKLPTGHLFIDEYSKGKLETLSIGDYGKDKNVKAEFLGFNKEINGVANGNIMPLSEKWVVTLSTQYGCPMDCVFCDCPKIGFKGNASFDDMKQQLYNALRLYPDVNYAGRLNVHFARMGEPAYNAENIFDFCEWMYKNKMEIFRDTNVMIDVLHPVFTTSCPSNVDLKWILIEWCYEIKNGLYNGCAGLQLSINSTNEQQRQEMFNNRVVTLEELSEICKMLPYPIGRKYCLNFAYATGYETDGEKLAKLFDPDKFMVKITPIHNNVSCKENNIETIDGYHSYAPYRDAEKSFKDAGFDVLVFIPSMDEEDSLITCGNALLSGSTIKNEIV